MPRIACSPVTWGTAALEHVLDDIADAGYAGVEVHRPTSQAFARQPARLRSLLDERSLALSAVPFEAWYFDRQERKEEVERLRRLADFIAEIREGAIIVFQTVPNLARRDMVAGEPPLLPLTPDRFAYLGDALNEACDLCTGYGLVGTFRNRVGSFVETPDEYRQVIERTDPELVRLAPDIGHLRYAGGDPATFLREHLPRLAYPRLKDWSSAAFDHARAERQGFTSFLWNAGLKELGEGDLGVEAALAPLVKIEYDGWVCVELERTSRGAKESALLSRSYLRDTLHW
jgi:inosose dehydratase